jgi:nitrogen fixation NifU-like protein
MDIYREQILEHYKHPQNFGKLKGAKVTVKETNASCGDEYEYFINSNAGQISEIAFQGVGCAISMAANSLVTQAVKGKTLKEVAALTEKDVFQLLGIEINPGRVKCASLPLRALKKGLTQLQEAR